VKAVQIGNSNTLTFECTAVIYSRSDALPQVFGFSKMEIIEIKKDNCSPKSKFGSKIEI